MGVGEMDGMVLLTFHSSLTRPLSVHTVYLWMKYRATSPPPRGLSLALRVPGLFADPNVLHLPVNIHEQDSFLACVWIPIRFHKVVSSLPGVHPKRITDKTNNYSNHTVSIKLHCQKNKPKQSHNPVPCEPIT